MSHRLLIAAAALLLSLVTACGQDDDGPSLIEGAADEITEDVTTTVPIGPSDLGGTAWTIQFIDGNPVDDVAVTFTSLSRAVGVLAMGHTDACGEGVVEFSFFDTGYDVISVSYSPRDGCAPASSLASTFSVGEKVSIEIAAGDQLAISSDENEVLGRHFESVSVHDG